MKVEQKAIFEGNGNLAIGTFIFEMFAGKITGVWVRKRHWIPFLSTTVPVLGNVTNALENYAEYELIDVLYGRKNQKVRKYNIDLRTGQIFTPELPVQQIKELQHLRVQLDILEHKLQEYMELAKNDQGGDVMREKFKDLYDFFVKDLKPPIVVMNPKKKGEE